MADLFNQQISATYSGLLKTTSNGVLSSSLAQITDGRGNGSQLYLSTSKINFYNAYEFPTNDSLENQVLKTDGSGVLTWEDDANTGTVQVSGTPTANEVAIWTDATTIKGDASFTMSSSTFQVNNSTASSQSNLIISNNDTAINSIPGNILFNSNTLTNYKTLAQIFATKTDADLSDASGKLNFATTDAGTASTKFIINSNGLSEFFGSVNAYNTPSLKLYSLGQEGYFNTEFLEIKKSSTNAILNVNKVGTGSIRGLEFQTGGSPKLTISSGGDVKIGDSTTDVTSKLTVSGNGSVNTATFMYDGNAGTYFDIDTEAANGSVILSADARSGNYPPMIFKTGGSPRLTISSGGDVVLNQALSIIKGGGSSTGRFQVANHDTTSYMMITGNTYPTIPNTTYFVNNSVVALTISSGGQVIVGGSAWNGVSGVDGGFEIEGNSAQFLLNNPSFNHFTMYSAADSNIYNIFGSTGNYLIGTGNKDTSSFSQKIKISSVGDVTIGSANDPYLYMVSSGGNGYNSRFRMYGYADGGTYGGGFKIDTRDSSNVFNNALAISSGGAATFMGGTVVDYVTNVCRFYGNVSTNTFALGANNTMYYQGDASQFYPTIDNTRALGTGSYRYTTVYASNGSINTSDFREKTEIKPTKLGLDFINDLKPISYKWIDGKRHIGKETIKDERNHQGLIAQEIAETLEKHGINKNDFGGLDIQKTNKYDDFHGMAYSQLIAPMIKAIQEQQTIIEDLKARIETLEG